MTSDQSPTPRFRFIYAMANDVAAMRRFYVELVGVPELGYRAGAYFVLGAGEGLQIMFFKVNAPIQVPEAFAMQPGWEGGTVETTSWSIEVPEASFAATVERLRAAGTPAHAERPMWFQDSYWGFPVRDPMGNTVEVYTTPAVRPASTDWR
ncbi:MAG: hypothetical protein HY722_03035 [Planctomycetes bacterium]|nr:hypothetical protein [Planctomycetota bacterium]